MLANDSKEKVRPRCVRETGLGHYETGCSGPAGIPLNSCRAVDFPVATNSALAGCSCSGMCMTGSKPNHGRAPLSWYQLALYPDITRRVDSRATCVDDAPNGEITDTPGDICHILVAGKAAQRQRPVCSEGWQCRDLEPVKHTKIVGAGVTGWKSALLTRGYLQ